MNETVFGNWMIHQVQWAREVIDKLIPSTMVPGAGWTAAGLLALGLLIGIFGAVYARGLITVILGGVGLVAGLLFGDRLGVSGLSGALIGVLLIGAVGFFTFRLWVGLAIGMLAGVIAMFAAGQNTLLPEFAAYEYTTLQVTDAGYQPELPTAEQQQRFLNPTPYQYLASFYQQFRLHQPQAAGNIAILILVCVVGGLVFGTIFTRAALIPACAIASTLLLATALGALAETFAPAGWEYRAAGHPNFVLGFLVAVLFLSMLLQLRMTRQHSTSPPKAEKPKN